MANWPLWVAAISVIRDELRRATGSRAAALDVLETFETPNRLLVIADEHGRSLAENWNGLEPQPIHPPAEIPCESGPSPALRAHGAFVRKQRDSDPYSSRSSSACRSRISSASSSKPGRPCSSAYRSPCFWRLAADCGSPRLACVRSPTWPRGQHASHRREKTISDRRLRNDELGRLTSPSTDWSAAA